MTEKFINNILHNPGEYGGMLLLRPRIPKDKWVHYVNDFDDPTYIVLHILSNTNFITVVHIFSFGSRVVYKYKIGEMVSRSGYTFNFNNILDQAGLKMSDCISV
jgi:hypothetical protein